MGQREGGGNEDFGLKRWPHQQDYSPQLIKASIELEVFGDALPAPSSLREGCWLIAPWHSSSLKFLSWLVWWLRQHTIQQALGFRNLFEHNLQPCCLLPMASFYSCIFLAVSHLSPSVLVSPPEAKAGGEASPAGGWARALTLSGC